MEDFVKNNFSQISDNLEKEININPNNEDSLIETRNNHNDSIKNKSNRTT